MSFTSTLMNFDDPSSFSLDGNLLLADPSLGDPNFRRAVLFIHHHTLKTGAEGFVLNRPLGRSVEELSLATEVPNLSDVPVYVGGPVGTEHLVFASMHWREDEERLEFSPRLSAGEAAARLSEGLHVRAFVGHAGWAAGQLEGEIRERSWIAYRPDQRFLEFESAGMWKDTLEAMSPWHYLLAKTPEDPSLN